jgi:site-specific DNA-methyltransferase (adenine-specific)
MSNLENFKYDLIWSKNKSTGFLNAKKMPLRKHESILIFYKNPPIYNPQKTSGHFPVHAYTKNTDDGTNYGKSKVGIKGGGATDRYPTSIINVPVVNNDSEDKFHPTQKPIELFEWLIKTYTNEGMIVLDNCVGSGTTCLASKRTNRIFIGIEKNPEYCEIAKKRLEKEDFNNFFEREK